MRELKARRQLYWKRIRELLRGRTAWPETRYTGLDPDTVRANMAGSKHGTLFVSCHTQGFYHLLNELERSPIPVNSVVSSPVMRALKLLKYEPPTGFVFSPRISKDSLRALARQEQALFMMADVLTPLPGGCCVAMAGQVFRYSAAWVKLCIKMKLDVVPIFVRDTGTQVEIKMHWLPWQKKSISRCVKDVFVLFEEFLDGDFSIWENYPPLKEFSFPLLPIHDELTPELMQMLIYLGMCDFNVAKVLKRNLGDLALDARARSDLGARLGFSGGQFHSA